LLSNTIYMKVQALSYQILKINWLVYRLYQKANCDSKCYCRTQFENLYWLNQNTKHYSNFKTLLPNTTLLLKFQHQHFYFSSQTLFTDFVCHDRYMSFHISYIYQFKYFKDVLLKCWIKFHLITNYNNYPLHKWV